MFQPINLKRAWWVSVLLQIGAATMSLADDPSRRGGPSPDKYGNWIARTEPLAPEAERRGFHLPPGFDIQLVAAEPDIRKPINMAFDRRGRLWVTQSIEYPIPAKDDASARDAVKILEDFDSGGRARRITTFADHLNIPIGILPTADGAIVYSIPNIQHFIDADGDGKADRRDVLLGPFMYEDTHAMVNALTRGFDGWIYACHGYHNVSVIAGRDGHKVRLHMGSTFRFRPDGSRVEWVTQGRVNPFGMCVDPWERFFSADCHSRPLYELLRGAWYPSFEDPHDGLGFGPEICDHDHGSTAIAGILYYAGDNFPPEYQGTVFTGNVVTNRINHDRLERSGSSSRAVHQPDFLVCDDPWFRPVDIQLAPDGSIYVADFYDRIIAHDEVPLEHPGRDTRHGRIWRIVYHGKDGTVQAVAPRLDWSKATVAELIEDLGHANLTVRMLATHELMDRGGSAAVEPLRAVCRNDPSPERRAHSLRVLEQLQGLRPEMLRDAVSDPEPLVRVHAMGILRERPKWSAAERALAVAGLRDASRCTSGLVVRAAVEAAAAHLDPELLAPLFELRRRIPASDPQLVYAARLALREQFMHDENWARWTADSTLHEYGDLLADVSLGIPSATAAEFLFSYAREHKVELDLLQQFGRHISRYVPEPRLPQLFDQMMKADKNVLDRQVALVRGLCEGLQQRGARPSGPIVARAGELANRLLDTGRDEDFAVAAELARIIKLQQLEERLAATAANASLSQPRRMAACDALVAIRPKAHLDLLDRILAGGEEPYALREHAAQLLGRLRADRAADILVRNLATAPSDLATVIARALAGGKTGTQRLLDVVAAGKASAQLLTDRQVHEAVTHSRLPGVEKQIADLTRGLDSTDEQLRQLAAARKAGFNRSPGDAQRGAAVFERTCAICHRIGSVGAKIGPELEGIGTRGLDRLIEDTLDPSRNVDRSFRQTIIELEDGTSYSGLQRGEEGNTVVLADSQGQTIVIARDEIKERWTSKLSPMPFNIAADLPDGDYYDLLAFLLSQRQPTTASQPAGN